MKKSLPLCLLSSALLAAPAGLSAQIFIDDFSSADPLANYANGTGNRMAYSHNAAEERLDGSVPSEGSHTSAAAWSTSLGSFEDFPSYSFAIDFLTAEMAGNPNNNNIAIGFSTVASDWYGTFVGIEATLRHEASNQGSHFLRIRGEGGAGARHGQFTGSGISLQADTWYTLMMTVSATATPNVYDVVAGVYTAGLSPVLVAGSLVSDSINMASGGTALNPSDTLYAGFASTLNDNPSGLFGVTSVDNFIVIPEPRTYALLFGLAAVGLACLRRRR